MAAGGGSSRSPTSGPSQHEQIPAVGASTSASASRMTTPTIFPGIACGRWRTGPSTLTATSGSAWRGPVACGIWPSPPSATAARAAAAPGDRPSPTWLPLACDPGIHRKHDVPKRYDVGFRRAIPARGPRDELLGLLRRQFPDHFVGNAYFDEMAKVYSASRVAFNRSIADDVNMRVFEAVACGSLLVTNDLEGNGQAELFRDGAHLVTYRDGEDLLEKVAHYLDHGDEREAIAAAGRAEALARHTYRHRMERLLAEAEKVIGRQSVAVNADLPDPTSSRSRTSAGRSAPHPRSAEVLADLDHRPLLQSARIHQRQCVASRLISKHSRTSPGS